MIQPVSVVILFLSGNNRTLSPIALPVEEMAQTLQDLIKYFQPPGEDPEHEDKQNKLRSLKNRQNLFKDEVERDDLLHFINFMYVVLQTFRAI